MCQGFGREVMAERRGREDSVKVQEQVNRVQPLPQWQNLGP